MDESCIKMFGDISKITRDSLPQHLAASMNMLDELFDTDTSKELEKFIGESTRKQLGTNIVEQSKGKWESISEKIQKMNKDPMIYPEVCDFFSDGKKNGIEYFVGKTIRENLGAGKQSH